METELAWMAGFFDGEGTITVQVRLPGEDGNKHVLLVPHIAVKIKYGTEVLELFRTRFGGNIYTYARGAGKSWNLLGVDNLRTALTDLLPYLRVKREPARRLLEALNLWPSLKGVKRSKGECAWTPEATAKVMELAVTLNHSQSRNAKQKAHVSRVRRHIRKLGRVQPGRAYDERGKLVG